jgi:PAS domain S-box-containing protein
VSAAGQDPIPSAQPGELPDHEEVFRLVFEAAPNGIVVVDDQGRVVLVNLQAERMFGYTREEFLRLRIEDLVPERFQTAHGNHRESFMGAPNHRAMGIGRDLYGRRRDGTEFPVEVGLTPVTTNQGQLVVSSVVDTTERTRTENQLRRYAAELERSNSELRNFAHVASHDLQEPLRKISAFGERLSQHSSAALDEKGIDYLQRITDASRRMQGLIVDLLAFSRVTLQQVPCEEVALDDLFRAVLEDLEISVAESGAQVEIPVPLPSIEADPSQMRQLFQNLLSNALKFHRPGETPHVTVTPSGDERSIRLEFRDRGIGFEPKHAERIFGIFQRLHGLNAYPGTGVGLAICRKIVELHHGTITALGEPGAGATFIVELPRRQPPVPLR